MTFGNQLEEYMRIAGCTAKELSKASGISEATLSRYRNDNQISKITAEQLKKIATGLVMLTGDDKTLSLDTVYENLMKTANIQDYDFASIIKNLNLLIDNLNINSAELAKSLNYDPSYLSRIRSGQRKPADILQFVHGVSQYIVKKYGDSHFVTSILQQGNLPGTGDKEQLAHWICKNSIELHDNQRDFIQEFMNTLDRFDLNEYLSAIHFNETHIPSLPFYIPTNKSYYGIEQMRQGELDFFKCAMFSKKAKDIFMCSDMPMTDIAEDTSFDKKWMMAIAVILKKHFRIHIIHDIDRPLQEMLLGLEAWIPLYMTGQISSYYFKNKPQSIYHHLTYIHGNVALIGESISGYPQNGRYYLTKNKEEVNYYKQRAENILSKATPLMQVFGQDNQGEYTQFLQKDAGSSGNRKSIYSVLPIYTLSRKLFYQIGTDNHLSENEISILWQQIEEAKIYFNTMIENNTILDEVADLSTKNDPIPVSLSSVFCDKKIVYSPEQYQEHLALTKEYTKKYENYTLNIVSKETFKNIDIMIHEGKWAMISKKTSPAIHFVIREKRLLNAIENFSAPVTED